MGHNLHTLGVDFGTSNSAAGFLQDGQARLIDMSPGQKTLPTTFFFDFDTRKTLIGDPANHALLEGLEGRFMRALKRVLGTTLMHEKRQILNDRVTFVDIIGRFLSRIKARAEAETGLVFERALSGRPVVFHKLGDAREAQAEADLRACYEAAGFREVAFLPEPEAAAIASGALNHSGDIGLIVDVGGGTTDFSLFKTGAHGIDIIASHGVRIGGTDFDRAISFNEVMPQLGKGSLLRKVIGPGTSPVPNAIFNDLATWEMIPFLYTGQNRNAVEEMLRLAQEPEKLSRLATTLRDQLGHDIAFAVERGKIDINTGAGQSSIDLGVIERNLSIPLSAAQVAACLTPHAARLIEETQHILDMAGLDANRVSQVVYVGGSSLMSVISETMRAMFPDAEHSFSDVFTAVVQGLALSSASTSRQAR